MAWNDRARRDLLLAKCPSFARLVSRAAAELERHFKPGACVVAAGVSFKDGKLLSDVADTVQDVAGWLSPRVGGVGPMTRARLMWNTGRAAEKAAGE